MKTLKFYKEGNDWFVDLPEWEGSKADLQMVSGADTMLEYMAEGEVEVKVTLSEQWFEGSTQLIFIEYATEIGNGAYYKIEKYFGNHINLRVWLCDVTLFVLGKFPHSIFISRCNL